MYATNQNQIFPCHCSNSCVIINTHWLPEVKQASVVAGAAWQPGEGQWDPQEPGTLPCAGGQGADQQRHPWPHHPPPRLCGGQPHLSHGLQVPSPPIHEI